MGPEVRAAYAPAFEVLEELPAVRRAFTGYEGDKAMENEELANQVFSAYTELVGAFLDALSTIATHFAEAPTRHGVTRVHASIRHHGLAVSTTRITLPHPHPKTHR